MAAEGCNKRSPVKENDGPPEKVAKEVNF